MIINYFIDEVSGVRETLFNDGAILQSVKRRHCLIFGTQMVVEYVRRFNNEQHSLNCYKTDEAQPINKGLCDTDLMLVKYTPF